MSGNRLPSFHVPVQLDTLLRLPLLPPTVAFDPYPLRSSVRWSSPFFFGFLSLTAFFTPQECFPDGYTPVTANTAVTLGNLLIKREFGAGTAKGGTPATCNSQASPMPERKADSAQVDVKVGLS